MSQQATIFGVPFCGRVDDPGVALDQPQFVDYSQQPISTPDQQRIEAVLGSWDLTRKSLLHVGVGNSSLAQRFAPRCEVIDGITVSPRERDRAQLLALPNYQVVCANKYAAALPGVLSRRYDFIIDNNLASFACCGFHLLTMFSNYRLLLKHQGMVLTDQAGMDWVAGDACWRMSGDSLTEVARRLSMSVARLNASVYAMVKP